MLFNLRTDLTLDSLHSDPRYADPAAPDRPATVSDPDIPILKQDKAEYAKLQ